MHPSYKNDSDLGKRVNQNLIDLGLETPTTDKVKAVSTVKIEEIAPHFREIMEILGLDLTDDSLCDTPNRVAKMYVNEIFYGLDYSKFPKCTAIENKMKANGSFLLEKNIRILHFI